MLSRRTARFTPPAGTLINVAAQANGGIATASSVYSSGYPAEAANDGDRQGQLGWWNDNTVDAYPDWLQVDFAGSASISEVDVFGLQDNYGNPVEPDETLTFSKYGLTAFEVQYWDGVGWVTVPGGDVTGNDKVWRQFAFPAVTTDRIRVLINEGSRGDSRVVEVEVFGTF